MAPSKTQVLIAGAGPVGLTLALELTRQGVSCRIVDCAPEPTDKSKALVLWSRSLELLDAHPNLVRDMFAGGNPVRAANIVGNNKTLVRVEFHRADTAFPQPLILPQCDTERILTEHLAAAGVEVERSVELIDFIDDADRVLARLKLADGKEQVVQCRYLAGCDGAHSTARHKLGIDFTGCAEQNDWILADVFVDGEVPQDELSIFWHARGIAALFPIGGGRFRIVADGGPATGAEKPPAPSLHQVQAALDERGLERLKVRDPFWLSGFRIHERKVDHYGRGRVFLAGDAAHIHSPAGGQGMNTGMQDAVNLAWKLALVERGWARPELLATYSLERSAIGDLVLRNATRLTQVASLRNPFLQFIRNHTALIAGNLSSVQERMVASLTELSIHYPHSPLNGDDAHAAWSHDVAAGDRLPDAIVEDARSSERIGLQQALRGDHFWLLVLPENDDPELLATLAAEAGSICGEFPAMKPRLIVPQGSAVVAINRPGGTGAILVDVEGQVRTRLGVRGTALAVVRPDGYLSFRGRAQSFEQLRDHVAKYLLAQTNAALVNA